jgi:hypothetical protein
MGNKVTNSRIKKSKQYGELWPQRDVVFTVVEKMRLRMISAWGDLKF